MALATRTVLCVDDDPDDREMISFTISQIDSSYKVVQAEDGLEALDYLSKAKELNNLPCLVILDINMPRMNGKQTLAAIKKDDDINNVPVVVFTTSGNLGDEIYCKEFGVELVIKPASLKTMQNEVKRLLQLCR